MKAYINERLRRARDARDDEFYTQYSDIARELKYYESKFGQELMT